MQILAAKRASPVPLRWMRTIAGSDGSGWNKAWLSSVRAETFFGFCGGAIEATAVAGLPPEAAPSTGFGAVDGAAPGAAGEGAGLAAATGVVACGASAVAGTGVSTLAGAAS